MTFDKGFVPDNFRVYLWANRGEPEAIRFEIGTDVLTDVLGGGNPVADGRNVETCERQRARIQAACIRAAGRATGGKVHLVPADFDDA